MKTVYRIFYADQAELGGGNSSLSDRFNDVDYTSEADAETALGEYFHKHQFVKYSFIIQKMYIA